MKKLLKKLYKLQAKALKKGYSIIVENRNGQMFITFRKVN